MDLKWVLTEFVNRPDRPDVSKLYLKFAEFPSFKNPILTLLDSEFCQQTSKKWIFFKLD